MKKIGNKNLNPTIKFKTYPQKWQKSADSLVVAVLIKELPASISVLKLIMNNLKGQWNCLDY